MATEMGLPGHDDVRRRATMRLAAAALVTLAALAGLWWLDHEAAKPKAPVPPTPAKPILTAPVTEPALPPVAAEPTASAGVEVPAMPPSANNEPPPPPRVSNTPMSPPAPPVAPAAVAPPVRTATPMAAPPPPAGHAVTVAGGYVVQLGVFTDPERARELVERLKKQGIRAQLETRVQVGPFLNRAEADKAAQELKKLGLNAVLIPPTTMK